MDDDTPTAGWLFEIVGPIVWIVFATVFFARARRDGALTLSAVLFFATTTMFWQEWYTDWGAYLLFSDDFALMPWGTTTWTTPNKPWAVIAGYGWFFAASIPALRALCARVARRRNRTTAGSAPAVSMLIVAAVVGPIFWIGDVAAEGLFTTLNWYEYTNPWGPAIASSNGDIPILYPALVFVLWAVVCVWLLLQQDDRGWLLHERVLRVDQMGASWRRELARVGATALMVNVTFWFLLVFPTVLARETFGGPSKLVP